MPTNLLTTKLNRERTRRKQVVFHLLYSSNIDTEEVILAIKYINDYEKDVGISFEQWKQKNHAN